MDEWLDVLRGGAARAPDPREKELAALRRRVAQLEAQLR